LLRQMKRHPYDLIFFSKDKLAEIATIMEKVHLYH
jgi:hypothetical protein